MSADPNKKSARTFQCRDVLWETFEQMARELECSVDYLVNEAMKQYARQRSYGAVRTPYPGVPRMGEPSQSGHGLAAAQVSSSASLPYPGRMPSGALPPPPTPSRGAQGRGAPLPAPRGTLPVPPPAARMVAPPPSPAGHRSVPPPASRSIPPPLPRSSRTSIPVPANGGLMPPPGATLFLVYNGESYPITKDRFVIGRGKQTSDLTLKDPNVSRQHALIEFQNGVYFMVDMGSTNGVAYNGQRIARKQIGEGDVFRICDHDIQFTYR